MQQKPETDKEDPKGRNNRKTILVSGVGGWSKAITERSSPRFLAGGDGRGGGLGGALPCVKCLLGKEAIIYYGEGAGQGGASGGLGECNSRGTHQTVKKKKEWKKRGGSMNAPRRPVTETKERLLMVVEGMKSTSMPVAAVGTPGPRKMAGFKKGRGGGVRGVGGSAFNHILLGGTNRGGR